MKSPEISHFDETEIKPEHKSRFGDKEKIVEIMRDGEIEIVGTIEEVCENIPRHTNRVEIADIPMEHANKILGVKIQKGGEVIRCVFKPASGENEDIKHKTMVDSFYPRECSAYLVSEHFGFDLVPPTVIREINGEVGSLQLFLDHNYFKNFDPSEDTSKIESSKDWEKIAALDWMLFNCERHMDNMMVSRSDSDEIVAIDHGIVMSSENYTEMAVRGPSLQLSHDHIKNNPKLVELPEWLFDMTNEGLKSEEKLTEQLEALQIFDEHQIKSFWMRVSALVQHKKFLSKYNHKEATGISFLGAGY